MWLVGWFSNAHARASSHTRGGGDKTGTRKREGRDKEQACAKAPHISGAKALHRKKGGQLGGVERVRGEAMEGRKLEGRRGGPAGVGCGGGEASGVVLSRTQWFPWFAQRGRRADGPEWDGKEGRQTDEAGRPAFLRGRRQNPGTGGQRQSRPGQGGWAEREREC